MTDMSAADFYGAASHSASYAAQMGHHLRGGPGGGLGGGMHHPHSMLLPPSHHAMMMAHGGGGGGGGMGGMEHHHGGGGHPGLYGLPTAQSPPVGVHMGGGMDVMGHVQDIHAR